MSELKRKYGVCYTGSAIKNGTGGIGIHGYVFDELTALRFPKVPKLITPQGYEPKPTGPQLKDKNYNPTYKCWDLSMELGDAKVNKEHQFDMIDLWSSVDTDTLQRCNLLAILQLLESKAITVEHWLIYVDNEGTAIGWNKRLADWAKAKWCKPNGEPRANADLWQRLAIFKAAYGDKLVVRWCEVPSEAAIRNAALGVISSVNKDTCTTLSTTPNTETDYWESDKLIPTLLMAKWCYHLSGAERKTSMIKGVKYYHFMIGTHDRNKDDIELIGHRIGDSGFGYVLHTQAVPEIDNIITHHSSVMWGNAGLMDRSHTVMMVNLANIISPKMTWLLKRANLTSLWLKNKRNDLVAYDETLISKAIRPPLLSFRILDEEEMMRDMVMQYLFDYKLHDQAPTLTRKVCYTDITDDFYVHSVTKSGGKGAIKLSSTYGPATTAIGAMVNNPCSATTQPIRLVRGIELPTRNIMSALAPDNPKVHVVTWLESKIAFRYGLIIHTDNAIGFFTGNYSNVRVLLA